MMGKVGLFFVLSAILFCSSAITAHVDDKRVLATIGPSSITVSDFEIEMRLLRKNSTIQQKLQTLTPEGHQRLLDQFISQKALHEVTLQNKTQLNPQTEAYLAKFRQEPLAQAYLKAKLVKTPILEGDLKAYWDSHKDGFTVPDIDLIKFLKYW